jgi:hypothetical protein
MLKLNFIESHLPFFEEIISHFQNDATFLMQKLHMLYSLEDEGECAANTFAKIKYETPFGMLDKTWSYFLHGYECRFKNHENNQQVDVILKFKGEYSVLDPYFLGVYLKTHPIFSQINIENEFEDGSKIISVLKKKKKIFIVKSDVSLIIGYNGDEPIYNPLNFKGIKFVNNSQV